MHHLIRLAIVLCILSVNARAQTNLKPDPIINIPAAMKNCGALYTYDSISLSRKKYILAVDMKNKGIISVGGKQIPLSLSATRLVNKIINVTTYKGNGYTVILSVKTDKQTTKYDTESGTAEIIKGKEKILIKIHGQSGCNESDQEGN